MNANWRSAVEELLYARAREYFGLPKRRIISWAATVKDDGTATVLIRSFRDWYSVRFAMRDRQWALVDYWITDS